ncbi:MAG: class I SAM-dependent methyltransferase [Desulfovibrionaceae bacterium]
MCHSSPPLYAHPVFQKLTGGAWRPGGVDLTRHGLELCAFTSGMRVVDVGCGGGATLEFLQTQGLRALGLDLTPPAFLGSQIPIIRAHAAHLPLAAGRLDGVLCECVLSLVQDTQGALSEFARVLRPHGALLLSDLFVHEASAKPLRFAHNSCMDNALSRQHLEHALEHCGFHITYFEDHTALLRPLAAQLHWHGLDCSGLGSGRWGYGLWIARRTR